MSRNKVLEYMAYRNNIKRLLLIVGIWPNKDPSPFYRLVPYIFLLLCLSIIFVTFGYIKIHLTNVALVTKGLSVMASFMTVFFKVTSNSFVILDLCMLTVTLSVGQMIWIILNREDMYQLHDILDPYFSKLLSSQLSSQSTLKGVTTFQRLSWILTICVGFSCCSYVIAPIIFMFYQHLHQVHPIKYTLMYPTVYPWNIDPPGFIYKVHFIFESAATLPIFCITAGVDSLFTMYSFQMIAQFREMSHRILHIDKLANEKNVIRECVIQHQTMMKCRDTLQKIFGPVILWIMIVNALILCSLIFQISEMKGISIGKAVLFSAHLMCKMTQTFMYAWTGTCLTTESENYSAAVYAADWHTNKYFMSSILIILTQKPTKLTACNFSEVSMDIFVMVLNTTVSYYFLLQTLKYDLKT